MRCCEYYVRINVDLLSYTKEIKISTRKQKYRSHGPTVASSLSPLLWSQLLSHPCQIAVPHRQVPCFSAKSQCTHHAMAGNNLSRCGEGAFCDCHVGRVKQCLWMSRGADDAAKRNLFTSTRNTTPIANGKQVKRKCRICSVPSRCRNPSGPSNAEDGPAYNHWS